MNDAIKMQISAYVDGELPQNEAELLLRRLCQDRVLRQQAAEYLTMGRLLRGERSVAGMETLRERIAASLDDKPAQEELVIAASAAPRYIRPLAGAAIAATVAVAALIGLQQFSEAPEVDPAVSGETVAETVEDSAYTVPDQYDDRLRDYYLRHSESSSHIGVNSINARLVTYELRDGVNVDLEASEEAADEEASGDDASAEATDTQTP